MHRNDEAAKRIAMEGSPPSSPYSQRIAKALQIASSEHDDEVWRTAENGKHFKIETENGEIKKGFGGKMNGKKVSKKTSGSLAKGVTKQNTETAEQFHKAVHFVEKKIDKKPAGTKLKCDYPNDPLRRSSVFVKEADGTWTQHTYAGRIPLGRVHGWTSYMVGAEFVNNVKDTADALTMDGGEGSGNHNHRGVPGQRGGSAPSETGGSGTSGKKGVAHAESTNHWKGNDNGKLHEGSRARDYHNEHADQGMRDWFKKYAQQGAYHARYYGVRKICSSFGKQINDEIKERFKLRKKAGEAEFDSPQTEDIYDVLRDARPFGLSSDSEHFDIRSDLDEERTKEIVEEAASRFPTSWLESGKTRIFIHDTYGRANYTSKYYDNDGYGTIHIFARESPTLVKELGLPDDKISDVGIANTLAHEFGHACEENNSEVRSWAQQYLTERTKGKEESYNLSGEREIADEFFKSYMGRQYNDGATEITSVLTQALGYLSPADLFYKKDTLYNRDPESYRFILGMLTMARGDSEW